MANVFTKAERIVSTLLGLLERDTVLAQRVWRDAAGDFRGAKDDTITIRLPAYLKANKRVLRSGTSRDESVLTERGVDVKLTDDLYVKIPITDEELTLDIESFSRQVIAPAASAIVRAIEDEVLDELVAPTYQHTQTIDPADPVKAIFAARRNLNDSRVPMNDRSLAVGSAVEEVLLTSDRLLDADVSGSTLALREATIGRIAGMLAFAVPGLDPDKAYAFHRTAYVLSSRAPMIPGSLGGLEEPRAAVGTFEGFAIRTAQVLDGDSVEDKFNADVFTGTNHVLDAGAFDADGLFEPAVDPEESGADDLFIRGVELELGS